MEEFLRSLADYSVAVAVLFAIVWVGISGRVISKSVVAFYERRIEAERAFWQQQVEQVRKTYESRYFNLVDQHDKEVGELYRRLISSQAAALKQRESQMAAFLEYINKYQTVQDEVARIIKTKLGSGGK